MEKYIRKQILIFIALALVWLMLPVPPALTEMEQNPYITAYAVKFGDTLSSVCRRNNVDLDLVAAMNNMEPDAILAVGQTLVLPKEPELTYIIQAGDTLWHIAKRYGLTPEDLMEYNEIFRPERMQIGQVIKIPVNTPEDPIRPAMARKEASRGLTSFIWPAMGKISSHFGPRKDGYHHGMDIAAKTGTPIRAAKSGKVKFAGWRPIYGKTVIIDHGDNIKTVYGHASKILVKEGQIVKKGQIIAKVGSTGRTTGPHLHFEIHIGSKAVNPKKFLF